MRISIWISLELRAGVSRKTQLLQNSDNSSVRGGLAVLRTELRTSAIITKCSVAARLVNPQIEQ
jgi:hypothetical protein